MWTNELLYLCLPVSAISELLQAVLSLSSPPTAVCETRNSVGVSAHAQRSVQVYAQYFICLGNAEGKLNVCMCLREISSRSYFIVLRRFLWSDAIQF